MEFAAHPNGGGSMLMKPATKMRLERDTALLHREFWSIPLAEVMQEVEFVAATLLDGAHFDDYIPVLTHRVARAHFRERLAATA